jgi:hypothetical protein
MDHKQYAIPSTLGWRNGDNAWYDFIMHIRKTGQFDVYVNDRKAGTFTVDLKNAEKVLPPETAVTTESRSSLANQPRQPAGCRGFLLSGARKCPNPCYCHRGLSPGDKRKRSLPRTAISHSKTTRAVTSAWWFVILKAGWSGGHGTLNDAGESLNRYIRTSGIRTGTSPADPKHLPAFTSPNTLYSPYASHRRWRFY